MGIVMKQSLIGSTLSYVGVALGFVNILFIQTQFLDPTQVGLFQVVISAASLFMPFAQLGMSQVVVKYYPTMQKQGKVRALLTVLLGGAALGYAAFVALFFVFKQPLLQPFAAKSPEVMQWYGLILLLAGILVLSTVAEGTCRALLQVVVPNFVKDVLLRLLVIALILGFHFGLYGFNVLLWGLAVVYGLALLVLSAYLFFYRNMRPGPVRGQVPRPLFRGMLRFGLYAMLGAGASAVVMHIDSLMVTASLGLDQGAIYKVAFYIGVVIEVPRRIINQLSVGLMSRSFEKNDLPAVAKLYQQISLNQLVVGGLLFLGVVCNLPRLFEIMPRTEVYQAGYWVAVTIASAKLIDMAASANSELISMSRHYRFNIVATLILSVGVIGLNLLLIPQYGLLGAALASLAAFILFNLSKFVFIWAALGMQPFSTGTLKWLVVAGGSAALGLGLPAFSTWWPGGWPLQGFMQSPWGDLLLRSAIITVVYGAGVLGWRVSPEVSGAVWALKKRFLKR